MNFRVKNRAWMAVIVLSIGLLLVSGCSKSGKDQPAPAAETKAETPAVETTPALAADKYAGWVEYGSELHGFAIMTPKSFEMSRDKTQTEAGELELVIYMAEFPTVAYGVVCNDFPEGFVSGKDPHTILKGGSNGFVNQFNGTVTSEQVLTLDGHAGMELALTGVTQGVDIFAKGRFYLVGDRLYQVTVISEKGKEDLEAIDKFLQSFKLK